MQLRPRGACSRPSFAHLPPLDHERRREGRVQAAPMARLQKKMQAAVTTGTSRTSGLPCAMALRLLRGLPGAPGFLVTVARATRRRRSLRGISVGMPGPHGLAVRLGTVRRHDCSRRSPKRPPHPAPDVRDGRELSLVWDGMWRDKHKFGKKERRIFLSRGLDRANQVDAVREFGFSAQADFADFGAWQAGELVPTELPSGLACWLCENLRI